MRTLDEYLSMPYCLEIVPDLEEGGFIASYPDLPGCITCGETLESVAANAADAKYEWLITAIEQGLEIPEPDALNNYSGQFKLRIPKSLHRQLADNAKREGISMNQYCNYLLTMNDAVHSSRKDKNKAV